jgi:hypothetical protein
VELLTVDAVKDRLQLRNGNVLVDSTVQYAILGVKPWLENFLQSSLDFGERDDTFYLDSDGGVNPTKDKMFRLKCTNGFIRSDQSVVVYVDATYAAVQSTANVLDPTTYKVVYEKGYVLVPEGYADQYIRVVYQSGFGDSEVLPRWLTESAFLVCLRLLTIAAQDEIKADMANTLRIVEKHGAGVLDAHLRATSAAISAIQ